MEKKTSVSNFEFALDSRPADQGCLPAAEEGDGAGPAHPHLPVTGVRRELRGSHSH